MGAALLQRRPGRSPPPALRGNPGFSPGETEGTPQDFPRPRVGRVEERPSLPPARPYPMDEGLGPSESEAPPRRSMHRSRRGAAIGALIIPRFSPCRAEGRLGWQALDARKFSGLGLDGGGGATEPPRANRVFPRWRSLVELRDASAGIIA